MDRSVGPPGSQDYLLLIGLTIDWCVFCTAQELCWRGYEVRILAEGTDTVGGDEAYKHQLLNRSPLLNWAEVTTWDELQRITP